MSAKNRFVHVLPVVLAVALLVLAGCREDEEPLLEDRFGNPDSGWAVESQEMFDQGYQEGEYFIEVYEPQWFVWSRSHHRLTDVVIDVEARPVSGAANGHFGLICRYQSPDSFYYFAVADAGYYGILRVQDGEAQALTGEGLLQSSGVRPTGDRYVIRAVCQGDRLTLYVDGQQVASVIDGSLRRGDVGLGVGTGTGGAIRVHFDDLRVVAPEEQE
ncbi:MAG: hypothetical protein JW900_00215 [Anaerolineae bacterium]|nr:hypothetical protein [Anaerolineae bacterium]